MANVNSVSNSYSSIYGSRNVLSGLASGLDTEAMIENSVSGYKTKITQLQQQMESLTWKQDAYRSITDKMLALLDKFTSYTSKTNLASGSYFNQAVRNIISGTFASKISATGRTSSDVQIKSAEMATAAKYTVDGGKIAGGAAMSTTGGQIDWNAKRTVSNISGTMTLDVHDVSYDLNFGEGEVYNSVDDLVKGINEKLAAPGAPNVKAEVVDGAIKFTDGSNQEVSISGVSGGLANIATKNEGGTYSITKANAEDKLTREQGMVEYLSGKSINVTYNGTTKSISLKALAENAKSMSQSDALAKTIQDGLDKEFGKGQVEVTTKDGGLSFETKKEGSTLKVTSDAGEALEIGSGLSNYLDTNKTLGELLGKDFAGDKLVINGVEIGSYGADTKLSTILSDINKNSEAGVTVSFSSLTNEFVFTTKKTGADQKIEFGEGLASDLFKTDNSPKSLTLGELFGDSITWDANGKASLKLYDGGSPVPFPDISKNDTLEDLQSKLGVYGKIINYNENTGKYSAAQKRDGSAYSEEELKGIVLQGADGKSVTLKDVIDSANTDHNFTAGRDATVTATINGKDVTMQRSANTFEIDGLTVTLKGNFNTVTSADQEPVTIKTTTDTDNIVNDIKSFVEQYNALMKEIHDAYNTQPLKKSSGEKYSPLTEDDKSGMSETAVNNYEEKAKTGLLFGDSDLSTLYSKMQGLFNSTMSQFGITATYSQGDGLTQISLDEDKLRDALEKDPDKVRDAFTSSTALGGSSDGLMTKVKNLFETYASKSIGAPGVLVRKAGTKLSSYSLTHNEVQNQIDQIQEKIDSWQTKLNKKIDYYTRQFTALEKLMNTMNNQSSMLMGLMGGY